MFEKETSRQFHIFTTTTKQELTDQLLNMHYAVFGKFSKRCKLTIVRVLLQR